MSGKIKVGDRVFFTIGQHDEEGVVKGTHFNNAKEEVLEIEYQKQDGDFTIINRKMVGRSGSPAGAFLLHLGTVDSAD
ncbi:hypothetical protein ACQY0O_004540 [Thecaphora frezii]